MASGEYTDPLKLLIRIGISGPIILTLIVLWSYFIILAAKPLKKPVSDVNEIMDESCTGDISADCVAGYIPGDAITPSTTCPTGCNFVQAVTQAADLPCDKITSGSICDNSPLNCSWTPNAIVSGVGTVVEGELSSGVSGVIAATVVPGLTPTINNEVNSIGSCAWDIEKAFCNTHIHSGRAPGAIQGATAVTGLTAVTGATAEKDCGKNKTYHCNDGISESICNSNQHLDLTKQWCGEPGTIEDSPYYKANKKHNCCVETIYEPNINYLGIIGYMIITTPIMYLLIEKILDVFIFKGHSRQKNVDNQFNWLGGYISKNGALLFIFILVSYYLFLPLFRFFFVSYVCEGTNDTTHNGCNEPCEGDSDCVRYKRSGCLKCINNICTNPTFNDINADATDGVAHILFSVCSINDIMDDLTSEEITDIYQRYVTGGTSTTVPQMITGIRALTTDPDNEKEITSYYYRFYPGQELQVNDTDTPFRATIPIPYSDYNKTLNNYIILEQLDISYPSDLSNPTLCAGNDNQHLCNANLNCAYENNTCVSKASQCGRRYVLPTIEAINALQVTTDESLHNKVVRNGIDYVVGNGNGDNLYPCNDVVVDYDKLSGLQELMASNGTNLLKNTDMKDRINHFELKREECADKNGQCYMNDYICETKDGTPIPLKKLDHPNTNEYTIPEFTDNGCALAMNPCLAEGESCDALDYINNYLVKTDGICTNLHWSGGGWVAPSVGVVDESTLKCVPSRYVPPTQGITSDQGITSGKSIFTGGKVAQWISEPSIDPTIECKSVNRMPRSSIATPSGTSTTSGIDNYYRWTTINTDEYPLCKDWVPATDPDKCDNPSELLFWKTYDPSISPKSQCCKPLNTESNPRLTVIGRIAGTPPAGATLVEGQGSG